MKVNGVTKVDGYARYQQAEASKEAAEVKETTIANEDTGVKYEPTLETPTKTFKANEKVIAQLKKDAAARLQQLQSLVQQLISKQAGANADANDLWNMLREGKVEVDPETKAQAQADIAEDGYWGVNATSDRIIDFAMALTGGDKSKLGDMLDAFKKGYEQAEKTWGGELPEISQRTYDAVLKKFDNLMSEA